MANGWTQDQEQYDIYDDYHADHTDEDADALYEREYENLRVFGENTERGWQGRLELGADLDGLEGSDFTIDDESGQIRPKTTQELFMRDYGIYLGVIGVFLLFR